MMDRDEKEIEERDLEFIEGEFINIKQSTVRAVEGGHIELQQVGAMSIDGERVEVTQGASVLLRGNNVTLNQSISGVTVANETSVNFSFSPISMSREQTNVSRSAIGIMAAGKINSENNTALLVVTNKVEGNMTTLFDWRSALALGTVLGGVWGLLSLFRKR